MAAICRGPPSTSNTVSFVAPKAFVIAAINTTTKIKYCILHTALCLKNRYYFYVEG